MAGFPLTTTYAIMAVVELASSRKEMVPLQAKVIAQQQAIPVRFIEQVLHSLKQAGIIDSFRGAQGGYMLRKDPAHISLAEIVSAMNGASSQTSVGSLTGFSNGHLAIRQKQETLLSDIRERIQRSEQTILRSVSLQILVDRYQALDHEQALMYHI